MQEVNLRLSDHHVALVCDYSLEYLGGAQSAFLDQARLLEDAGARVTIIAPAPTETHGHPQSGTGFTTDRLEIKARFVLPGVDLPVIRHTPDLVASLRDAFDSRGITVLHVHSEFGLSSAAIDAAKQLNLPVAHTVHTFFWQVKLPRLLSAAAASATRLFMRWLRSSPPAHTTLAPSPLDSTLRATTLATAQRADVVISPSAHQAVKLREACLSHVVVIPNAVATLPDAAAPLARIEGPLRIAWIGRLVPEKRILPFVEAIKLATQQLDESQLHVDIVGDGAQATAARELAQGVDSIRFHGRLDREHTRAVMRDSHLVALTSFGFDNQPVTVVEAFSESRSVMYVDPALTEGLAAGGILTPSPEVDGMAETIVQLARSPERVVEASVRAHEAGAVFSPANHLELLASAYSEAQQLKNR